MTHTTHWSRPGMAALHIGTVADCKECGKPRHAGAVMSTGRHGCWAECLCGWRSARMATAGGASIAYAEHVRETGRCDATLPQDGRGGVEWGSGSPETTRGRESGEGES